MSKKIKSKSKNKSVLLLILALILFGAVVAFSLHYRSSHAARQQQTYTPPTKAEKASGNQQKQTIVNDKATTSTPAKTANVVIADASQYGDMIEVRAFVSNVFQNGSCVITLSKAGLSSVSKTVPANQDATTTQCLTADFDRSQFSQAGTWKVTISYTSDGVAGDAATTVEIK